MEVVSQLDGLNPISHSYKFPTPTHIRRRGDIDFRLRFKNPDSAYAQNITDGTDIEITGSISGFTGSKILVDTSDGIFITGSGGLFFGSDKENGFKYTFTPQGKGKDKEKRLQRGKAGKGNDGIIISYFKQG